jgi:hypothetical protein
MLRSLTRCIYQSIRRFESDFMRDDLDIVSSGRNFTVDFDSPRLNSDGGAHVKGIIRKRTSKVHNISLKKIDIILPHARSSHRDCVSIRVTCLFLLTDASHLNQKSARSQLVKDERAIVSQS